jgi:carbamoyltransferase
MTFTFEVATGWKERVPEVVHEDGSSRAQVLRREFNPRYYDLMLELEALTGNGVVLNTSLNRRGEAMICSPTDALNMFFGSDLQYLVMEDVLVVKESVPQPAAACRTKRRRRTVGSLAERVRQGARAAPRANAGRAPI